MGPDKLEVMKAATKGVDVKTIFFYVPPGCIPRQPLRLQEFRLEDVAHHIYDRFIES